MEAMFCGVKEAEQQYINKKIGGKNMLPSLYTAISGLRVNQQKLNVTSDNIANSSTTGFKSKNMIFEDMLSQNLSDPSAPVDGGLGGINARQSGLGVKVAGINTDFTAGSSQTTNRSLDFMANKGGSYFVVSPDGDVSNANGGNASDTTSKSYYYTRDGAFTLDEAGNLLTQDGYHVMGYNVDDKTGAITDTASGTDTSNIVPPKCLQIAQYYTKDGAVDTAPADQTTADNEKVTSWSVGPSTGIITVKTALGSHQVGRIALASFQNEGGLVKDGGNLYESSPNSGDAAYGTPGTNYGSLNQGALEMSNVDLAQQFTDMIVATRAFQANGKIITTDDTILEDLVNLKR
ncbi:flagellar basal-body rod protein FlgG [Clostridium coskatii]|uniref:Flagellar hook protein FlgE n=2 Tax=Clostridium coskatii TaxID=1705578 RepID=A0A170NIJ5_9CLOT|nr:Flagellar basal-body rod protein FlgG [Clostridium coskatii]OBR97398.1 flagellar basal-body rod protein FlgG [Clostridium coskatii]